MRQTPHNCRIPPLTKSRTIFAAEKLIFISGDGPGAWYKSADCIWSNGIEFRDKADAAKQYGADLEEFFLETVGIEKINIEMVCDELISNGAQPEHSNIGQIKSLLRALNSLLLNEDLSEHQQPERLLETAVLPVREPDGNVALGNPTTQFAIPDRKHLDEVFRDKIKTLDFTVAELQDLEPFIKWAGLEDRYLSKMVQEQPVLCGTTNTYPIIIHKIYRPKPHMDIKRKAHGLLR